MVSWISQGAAGLATGSQGVVRHPREVVGYPRDGTGATEVGAAGGGCRRQVWRRRMSRGAEDASGGGRHIGRRKMHLEAEEASEAEAEFEMERRGGRGFPLHLPLLAPFM